MKPHKAGGSVWGQAPLGGEGSWDSLSRVVSSVGLGLAVSHGGSDISGGGGGEKPTLQGGEPQYLELLIKPLHANVSFAPMPYWLEQVTWPSPASL